jgi:hypothetical protein
MCTLYAKGASVYCGRFFRAYETMPRGGSYRREAVSGRILDGLRRLFCSHMPSLDADSGQRALKRNRCLCHPSLDCLRPLSYSQSHSRVEDPLAFDGVFNERGDCHGRRSLERVMECWTVERWSQCRLIHEASCFSPGLPQPGLCIDAASLTFPLGKNLSISDHKTVRDE